MFITATLQRFGYVMLCYAVGITETLHSFVLKCGYSSQKKKKICITEEFLLIMTVTLPVMEVVVRRDALRWPLFPCLVNGGSHFSRPSLFKLLRVIRSRK